jgi:thioredoxin-like negative regulator of GroEL
MSYYLEALKTKPILIEFTSPGCTICASIESDVEEFEKEISANWRFVKIDASVNMPLVVEFDVYGSPTFIVIKGGQVLKKFKGNTFDDAKDFIRDLK